MVLFSNMWKQFVPSESGLIIDRLVIPPMVDFDSILVNIDSLHAFYIDQQNKRTLPLTFFEKVFMTKEMQKMQIDKK